jgi:hypothetical protein
MPDDPPGTPARPAPGALPASPVQLGPFTSIQVNVGPGGVNISNDAANEPSIAVDPTFPNRLAIGWRQFDSKFSNFRQAGRAYSTDGGRTWTAPGVLEPGVFRSDPVLSFDAAGNFYYASLKVVSSVFSVDVFKSWDRGVTWAPAVYAFGGDKQWITVDRTGGIGSGHIYQAWSSAAGCCGDSTFNRSTNGGMGFSVPDTIPMTPVWGTLAVGPDGALYIGGTDIGDQSMFYVAKSKNAQDPGVTPSFDTVTAVDLGGSLVAFGGGTTPNPDGLLGQVCIAVDHSSGPTAGYVYMLASVDPPGLDPLDVHFVRSTDGGLTWSPPVRVNDDPSTTQFQWFGTMSVSPGGRIDVVWNDTRSNGVRYLSELYYSFSTNGGLNWATNQVASPVWDSYVGWPNQSKIGDYYDMVSDDLGAHLAWAATFNNEQDVYYLRIGDYDCNSNGVADPVDIAMGTSPDLNGNGIPDECDEVLTGVVAGTAGLYQLHQNVPNPFNPITTIRYEVPVGGGHVALRVFDVTGRLVTTLVEGFETGGAKSVFWDGKNTSGEPVSSGLYLYELVASGFTDTKKMLLLR